MRYLLPIILFISACSGGGTADKVRDKLPGKLPPPGGDNPTTLWDYVMHISSGLAGLAFVGGIILLWLNPKKGQQLLCIAVSVLVGCQVSLWISKNLWWIGLVTVVIGLGCVAYRHRNKIEDLLDGDDQEVEDAIETEKITDANE